MNIYIYIEREREIDRQIDRYVYIEREIDRERERESLLHGSEVFVFVR